MNIEAYQDAYAAMLRRAAQIENKRMNLPKDAGQAIAVANRARMIATLSDVPLETAEIARALGIGTKVAQKWLARLEREGAAVRSLERRGGGLGGNLHKWRRP